MAARLVVTRAALLGVALLLGACATTPYRYGVDNPAAAAGVYPPMAQHYYQGAPHRVLDAADWYWPYSLLGKLLLWNRNIDSHEISPVTVAALRRYLDCNGLDHVQVLVNRYAPGNQWIRLFRNRSVGAGWRYTLGILSVAIYSALPGRFFGGDAYNPYTNTIYLYSDDPEIALHEGGHAKDFAGRRYKGLNAFLYALPFAALFYEARATADALGYLRAEAAQESLREGYRTLYPAYGTYVGGSLAPAHPAALLGVLPGHLVGNLRATTLSEQAPADHVALNACLADAEGRTAKGAIVSD